MVESILLNPNEERIKWLNILIQEGKAELRYVESFALSSHNARLIYLCGRHIETINRERIAHALANTLESYYILEYAYYIQKQIDINDTEKKNILTELGKGMARSGCPFRAYFYARDISYAPINKLAEALAKSDSASDIFYTLRDLGSKIEPEIKEKLERRIIALEDSGYIISTANIATEVSLDEFVKGLLNAKQTNTYGAHLYMFLQEHEILNIEIRNKILNAIMNTNDYNRIFDLIKSCDNLPYKEIINSLLYNPVNYSNPNFWLNYIIPLAISNLPSSPHAVDKIIKSGNVEFITITLYYIQDEALKQKLDVALKHVPNLYGAYDKTELSGKVIKRVLKASNQRDKNNIA